MWYRLGLCLAGLLSQSFLNIRTKGERESERRESVCKEGSRQAGKVETYSMYTLPLRDSRRQCQIVDHGLPSGWFLRFCPREHLVYHVSGVGVVEDHPFFCPGENVET